MNRKQVFAATAVGLALGAAWTLTSGGVFGQSLQSVQVPAGGETARQLPEGQVIHD
jgi:hypothetical protein